ncbi:MAG TPA: aminotransferase class I/II-fold pyridoxal phosphate-dependent enzyme [Actinomycetota bacterium]|nr:aminotransferase class I/II-fold pyridoxal phosphate-dependent enzyme [Actinomycetota bacterium]
MHPPVPEEQPGTPVAPPLDLASTYSFTDSDTFATASREKVGEGYVYARWANRTVDAFEAAVAGLEGAEVAEAFSSGMAAISAIFLGLCSQGDRIVAARQLYGNTYSLLADRLPRYGIETAFVDVTDHDGIREACAGAKLLYCETIGNPRVQVADLDALAEVADGAGIPLVVDNTFASPALCRPLEHGASLVVHSATKFLGGHHDLLGGIVCGDPAGIGTVRAVARDLGPSLAPFNAWLALRGIATLPLRVQRANENALEVARALEAHEDVEGVYYPALASDPGKPLADRLLGGRGGGMLGFDVAGGRGRAERFQELLETVSPAASLGGTHSLIVHAASVTHTQLSDEELRAAGISEGFCRLSVGLEDARDIIDDLDRALRKSA